MTLLAILCGEFKTFSFFIMIILFHELGHILAGYYYHWRIEKILILPFGALTIFKEHLNKPLKEEWIITIMGPIFQMIFASVLPVEYLPYHYALLCFNLLPIVPLDGSKLWNIILNKITTFQISYQLTQFFSVVILIGLVFYLWNCYSLISVLIIITLGYRIYKDILDYPAIFSKFLLERILYNFHFSKTKVIYGNRVNKMKKEYKHLFVIDGIYQSEQKILQKRFDFKGKRW